MTKVTEVDGNENGAVTAEELESKFSISFEMNAIVQCYY